MSQKRQLVAREFRHGTYVRHPDWSVPEDAIVVKENLHYSDGSIEPNVQMFYNFKRPFWVTRPEFRNHKDKKEWEKLQKLQKFTSTQHELTNRVASALGRPGVKRGMKQLTESPYIYGTDIPITSLLKAEYQKKWPNHANTKASVAVLDIETHVEDDNEEIGPIRCISLTYKNKVYTAVLKDFVKGIENPIQAILDGANEHLKELIQQRNITFEIELVDTPGQAIMETFKRANLWQPDFIAIWNMNFDLNVMDKQCLLEGLEMKDVVSHPSVPEAYRKYKFVEGPDHRISNAGVRTNLTASERWHYVEHTGNFYFIDAMCLYNKIRVQQGKVIGGYGFDNIMTVNDLKGKLKFEDLIPYTGDKRWHIKMQTRHPIEYIVYNIYDCIGIELLDEKTLDISQSFGSLCGISDFSRFQSNPKKIVDDLHFFVQERGLVMSTHSKTVVDEELNVLTRGPDGWIVTLQSHFLEKNGMHLVTDMPQLRSLARAHVADLDIEGTYPSLQMLFNISRETTVAEVVDIEGTTDYQRQSIGINMSGGTNNAHELCNVIYGFPGHVEMLNRFDKQYGSRPTI